jgi:sugar/nucleoside kinase (ribokinase family)
MGGGPVATALTAASKLGSPTTMLDTLGDGWQSKFIINELKSIGVSCDEIIIEPGAKASLASVLIRKSDGARAIRFVRSTAKALSDGAITKEIISQHKIIHCNGRHLNACLKAASECKAVNSERVMSFDGGAGRYRKELLPLMKVIDIAIVAKDFALKLSGLNDLNSEVWSCMKEAFPKAEILGITDGIKGSWFLNEDETTFHQPAYSVPLTVDTTGCGDVYHGAFLNGILRNLSVEESAKMASAAGALNAMKMGGRGNLVNHDRLNLFLEKAKKIESKP